MAGINGIWGGNSYSYMYGNTNTNSYMSGNILGIDLGEYASITRGSYSKLIKAYYQKYGKDDSASGISSKDKSKDDKESKATKNTLKTNANELYKTAGELTKTGKKSLFEKVDIKDEDGNTTKGYDTDKIYKAVNSFVESYNKMVKSATDSMDNAVLRQTLRMIRSADSNGKLLSSVGIKINADNTLTIDEEKFKAADMGEIKTLFNGEGSFASRVQDSASNIYRQVNNSMGNSNSYTAAGNWGNYTSGNILDSLL